MWALMFWGVRLYLEYTVYLIGLCSSQHCLSACLHQSDILLMHCGPYHLDLGYFRLWFELYYCNFYIFFQRNGFFDWFPLIVFSLASESLLPSTPRAEMKQMVYYSAELPCHSCWIRPDFVRPRLETSEQAAPVMVSLMNAKGNNKEIPHLPLLSDCWNSLHVKAEVSTSAAWRFHCDLEQPVCPDYDWYTVECNWSVDPIYPEYPSLGRKDRWIDKNRWWMDENVSIL
jgi:hypothetical protein